MLKKVHAVGLKYGESEGDWKEALSWLMVTPGETALDSVRTSSIDLVNIIVLFRHLLSLYGYTVMSFGLHAL